ncbi:hypothetical protein NM688_g3593 [Phlebia brevispora]|uniref:Uncharacterized protein n=1 Tax=Phlebia brevispora TaxID=194682 RepID=A0ACC1T5J0_9APHY|nr:hypothetical protein NM688_g3593 [Phlebia brevispora]
MNAEGCSVQRETDLGALAEFKEKYKFIMESLGPAQFVDNIKLCLSAGTPDSINCDESFSLLNWVLFGSSYRGLEGHEDLVRALFEHGILNVLLDFIFRNDTFMQIDEEDEQMPREWLELMTDVLTDIGYFMGFVRKTYYSSKDVSPPGLWLHRRRFIQIDTEHPDHKKLWGVPHAIISCLVKLESLYQVLGSSILRGLGSPREMGPLLLYCWAKTKCPPTEEPSKDVIHFIAPIMSHGDSKQFTERMVNIIMETDSDAQVILDMCSWSLRQEIVDEDLIKMFYVAFGFAWLCPEDKFKNCHDSWVSLVVSVARACERQLCSGDGSMTTVSLGLMAIIKLVKPPLLLNCINIYGRGDLADIDLVSIASRFSPFAVVTLPYAYSALIQEYVSNILAAYGNLAKVYMQNGQMFDTLPCMTQTALKHVPHVLKALRQTRAPSAALEERRIYEIEVWEQYASILGLDNYDMHESGRPVTSSACVKAAGKHGIATLGVKNTIGRRADTRHCVDACGKSTHKNAVVQIVETLEKQKRWQSTALALPPHLVRLVLAFEEVARNQRLAKYTLISVPPEEQFRHTLYSFLHETMSPDTFTSGFQVRQKPGLKKSPPYWYSYTSMAKGRWLGRELLEIVSTESAIAPWNTIYALESGVTTVNGKIAKPETIIKNGDRIENVVHRHEPPVASTPVKIILEDKEREFIVIDKPGSIPVHPAGRYFKHSLTEILKTEFGYKKICTVNRLDRLTSGLMIIPTSPARAHQLTTEFMAGTIRKEYVARCKGEFPAEEVICEEPLLTIDRQMGLNIVHPEGKSAKTIFQRLHYDASTDSSVVLCKPMTGRSHQIRVHLQYLGHPIANDTIYSEERIWGENLGKGGIDITPSEERAAPVAPPQFQFDHETNPENVSAKPSINQEAETTEGVPERKLLPRETGHDIGMGSPVPLSAEAVSVITNLRNMKDEAEDWSRWRDVVFQQAEARRSD